MFDKFGEFDSWEELNKAAEGQKEEGDIEALKELALENGFEVADAEDYMDGVVPEFCTALLAAESKIRLEKKDLKPKVSADKYIDDKALDPELINLGLFEEFGIPLKTGSLVVNEG